MKNKLEILGIILFLAGLVLFLNAQFIMETTILKDTLEINNLGLIASKLNTTIVGGILIVTGLQLVLNEDK